MVALWVIVMAVGLVGMIVCSKKQKTNPAMQPVGILLFIVVLIGAVMLLKSMDVFGGGSSSVLNSEMRFAESRGVKIAKYVAGIAGGKEVLFIVDKNYEQGDLGKRVVEALKKNCGGTLVLDSIPVPADAEANGTPIEEFMKASHMDALLAKHPNAAVIVSNIGLPQDAAKMAYFKAPAAARPKMVLMNAGFVTNFDFLKALQKGDIEAVIVTSPSAKYDIKAPGDLDKAFDIRYVLVTKANADQYKDQLPR
ncbi:MAG: sugar ABC transporter substrate-binding protein [Lentisphaeria bacterium]|nr:sugar ABC transporter substrate-binding protein [Lentisphaeria bacterium]